EAVGIDKAQLHFDRIARGQIADMGLARNGGRAGRDAVEVVDDARGGRAEMGDGERARIRRVEVILDLLWREVSSEGVERIALDWPRSLTHQRRADDHAQRVKPRL